MSRRRLAVVLLLPPTVLAFLMAALFVAVMIGCFINYASAGTAETISSAVFGLVALVFVVEGLVLLAAARRLW